MKNFRFSALLLSLLLASAGTALAQSKEIQHVDQVWLAYLNQTRLSDKWGIWADLHLRTKQDFIDDLSVGIVGLGLTRYLNDNVKLTAAYSFANHFPADPHKNISRPEHRPWQQLQWHAKYTKLRTMQLLRIEERYRRKVLNADELADGYNFNFRLRYNFWLQVPLSKRKFQPGTLSLVLNDELHINMGKEIVYNSFEQNRLFAGFIFHVNAHDNLQFGYMNVFQQLAAGNKYRSLNVARLYFSHNLDLRKGQKG